MQSYMGYKNCEFYVSYKNGSNDYGHLKSFKGVRSALSFVENHMNEGFIFCFYYVHRQGAASYTGHIAGSAECKTPIEVRERALPVPVVVYGKENVDYVPVKIRAYADYESAKRQIKSCNLNARITTWSELRNAIEEDRIWKMNEK